MKFVKLRLQGFKSFVDSTELAIAPGLTGVVGPNGCGKSNLLEALRWVMGETSARAMRGDEMEDVIFAGAATRPARSFAEVALHLDNRSRRAPLAFNDSDALEVVRRIARDAGSAYRLNGREVRAREVRMLFADAATGAHSPALVRQGRISELVNARPTARRAILEEAAGVSGLHQRRHEAELKLDAAARNLARVDEIVEQLDARLAQLSRQARQAARYRVISESLRRAELALVFLRWREADDARARADAALTEATRAAAQTQAAAAAAGSARAEAEAAVPPVREEAAIAGAILQRLAIERDQLARRADAALEAARAAATRLAQLEADVERERQLNRDAAESVARLDHEAAEIARSREGHDAALAEAGEATRLAVARLGRAEAVHDAAAADAARLDAQRQAAERRVAETAATAERARRAAAEATASAEALAGQLSGLAGRAASATAEADAAARAAKAAEAACDAAEAAHARAQSVEGEARAAAQAAGGEAAALRAEAQGLEKLLARGVGSADRLLDRVRAAPGFEAALGAALGDDLAAPLATAQGGGWRDLAPYGADDAPPADTAPLGAHVAAPRLLARRLARVALVSRAQGDALQPDLAPGWRLVSREGDLWRWDGFRVRAGDAPSAAAARLAQQNRLDATRAALTEAEARAEAASAVHAGAKKDLLGTAEADAQARRARRAADEAAALATRTRDRAAADLDLAQGRLETLHAARDGRIEDRDAAAIAAREALDTLSALGDPGAARQAAEAAKADVEAARAEMLAARAVVEEMRRRDAARERRLGAALKERATWAARLENAERRSAELEVRRGKARDEKAAAEAAPATIAAEREALAGRIRAAEGRNAEAGDVLASAEARIRAAETAERAAERAASEAREARARREAQLEAEIARADEAAARLAEAEPRGPEAVLEILGGNAAGLPGVEDVEIDIARERRQREALGAVNLRAEEDAAEVAAERDNLAGERADLEAAIAKLRQGVAELNREGRARLLAAFDEVDRTFRELFTHLFGGGEARLALVESDDPLEAGLEIMAMPPGKKLSTLSLLSGGEQTLTALALIFAVFLVNPSPICVLDEVDAPLDDANVGRFCDLLDEMTRRTETRFLVITHHAVTMSRMDRLFGVTMVEPGVSQLVSVDLALAAGMIGG